MSNTKQYDIEVIVNRKLKHSYISIVNSDKVVIKTPFSSQKFVDQLLAERAQWIEEKLFKMSQKNSLPDQPIHTLEFVQKRVEYFSSIMQLPFTQLKFRKMKRRWGSCTSNGVITLNRELLKVVLELVDYVVVHELAHLQHMNHSKEFHTLVAKYLPNEKNLRKELKNLSLV